MKRKVDNHINQRLDNYLVSIYKKTPRTHLYRMIRKGRIRINGKTCRDPKHRVLSGDELLIPIPQDMSALPIPSDSVIQQVKGLIIQDEPDYWLLNKPAGFCVHGGGNEALGIIEVMRYIYDGQAHLVHRLDRNTSGCLLIAKTHQSLVQFQQLWRSRDVVKKYCLLTKGKWKHQSEITVDAPLERVSSGNQLDYVHVSDTGKEAKTVFRLIEQYGDYSLLEATLMTGRTHQIRVHAQYIGHPIVGDRRYGVEDRSLVKNMFLHAKSIDFEWDNCRTTLTCCMSMEQERCLKILG